MKYKCMIFPFSIHAINFIETKNSLIDYEIISVCSLPSWINGFENIIEKSGLKIIDLSDVLKLNDINAVIVPPLLDLNYLNVIEDYINKLSLNKIEIINLSGSSLKSDLIIPNSNKTYNLEQKEKLFDINSCVINISTLNDYCDLEKLEVLLYNQFVKLGVKTKIISNSWCAELFNFHKFPEFMNSMQINETEKVYMFNSFIHEIDLNNTELIIISFKNPVLQYPGSFSFSDFSFIQYLAQKGCTPDFSIFCIDAKNYLKNELDIIEKNFIEAVGSKLNMMVMSSMSLDWVKFNDIEFNNNTYLKISFDVVEKYANFSNELSEIKILSIYQVQKIIDEILKSFLPNNNYYEIL